MVHHVAGRGAHDRGHPPRLDPLGRGHRDVRVDVAGGDGDALGQPGPPGRLGGEVPGASAELQERVLELVGDEAGEPLVERREVGLRRVLVVLADALVARGADVARLLAAELPHDPVGALDPAVHRRIDLRILLEQLQRLRELPLGGDAPAVARQPRLVPLLRQGRDPIGLLLGRVVLPELRVGVRALTELVELAQRRAVAGDGQRRRGGEVDGDAGDRRRVDPGVPHGGRNRRAQDLAIVVGVLERPRGGKWLARRREDALDHGIRVVADRRTELGAVAGPHDHRAA